MPNQCDRYHRALDLAAAAASDGSEPRHHFSRQWSALPSAEKEAWAREFAWFLDDACEEEIVDAELRRHPRVGGALTRDACLSWRDRPAEAGDDDADLVRGRSRPPHGRTLPHAR